MCLHKRISLLVVGLLVIAALAACGGPAATPTPTPAPTNTPAPTETPAPNNTPAPTTAPEELTTADLQATLTALEESLTFARSRFASSSSMGETAAAESEIRRYENLIKTVTPLLEGAGS